jgi:hypothetical protein
MDCNKPANPMMTTANAIAGVAVMSGMAVAIKDTAQTALMTGSWGDWRKAATRGITTRAAGRRMNSAGAGLLDGPNHQMGRPIVRLETATQIRQHRVRIEVITDTVRQPEPSEAESGTTGGGKCMFSTI